MPIKKSPAHPNKGPTYESPNPGSFANKQAYYFAGRAASKILVLIKTYDDLLSTCETVWRENNPYPITTAKFHSMLSNHRCEIYRRIITLLCTVPKLDEKTGRISCPDECVQSKKEKRKVRKRRKKQHDDSAI